ncbi:ssDNA-binding domain-containing protein [Algoriphagus sp. AGSA1]|uniref:ArdC family protein n=1 Tax=unclassified Algoriphagus TaxID=2641541 RepID=UPI00178178AB|nr:MULTISPECIES: zincin-like metallopeptidase domain-containing protein [unclassified Algoriphagus]MCE7056283.1 ssDNA-binding domain-containing protein [Algoriphagus sp. AGSA1]
MKTQVKTSAKTSTKRKGGNDFASNKGCTTQPAKGSSDIYRKFTDLIIEKLEQGVIPWRQPWHEMGMPANYLTKKPYRGINLWLLLSCGHQYPYYLTFKQANGLGGKIKKGAKALPICYWNFAFRDKKTGKVIPEDRIGEYDLKLVSKSGFLKEFKVFPIEQIEGIDWEFPEISKAEPLPENEQCQRIYEEMLRAPELIHSGSSAYYRADLDQITMPERNLFDSAEQYFGVLYHELVHSTGHPSRLNRIGVSEPQQFASEFYSKEELIAEMGAGYLNNLTGILDQNLLENSAAYIQHWLNELRNDKHLLIEAASKAQKAVDYILMEPPF